jgi:hypothetical protein
MKLKEAPIQMKIDVTQADINKGLQGDMSSCAIAKAVKRSMGDSPSVDDQIEVEINGSTYFYHIPKKAQTFIDKFDDDKTSVKPFTFVARLQKGN